MTDVPNYNFEAFGVAENIVANYSFEPISPADITGIKEGWEWTDYLRADIKLITDCDAIALLPGWQESKGACLEYRTARDLGLVAYEVDLNAKTLHRYVDDVDDGEPTVLEEAQRLVYGPREASYGHPYTDFTRTAAIWSAILGTEVTAKQAALCMVGVKLSREVNRPKRDNLIDGAGYFAVADRIETYEEG